MKYHTKVGLILAALFCSLVFSSISAEGVAATGLKVQPLIYNEQLEKSDVKKGYIDISNPTKESLDVVTSVKAFEQVDSNGSLRFYDEPELKDAIVLDLDEFTLGPREAIRMYFLLDAKKLPAGPTFASIFFTNNKQLKNDDTTGVLQNVRVGTILAIQNGPAQPQRAELSNLRLPAVSFGDDIQGKVAVKNIGESGMFSKLSLSLEPWGSKGIAVQGPLVFSGITRDIEFSIGENTIGVYKLKVESGGDQAEKWIFLATGYWKYVLLAILITVIIVVIIVTKRHRTKIVQ